MRIYKGILGLCLAALQLAATQVVADDREQIDASVERAVEWLKSDRVTAKLFKQSKGVLVFPDIVEMGFGVGGEFGEGVLLVDGETDGYYATAGKSFGLDSDVGYKAEVIFFLDDEALDAFHGYRSWKPADHAQIDVVGDSAEIKHAMSKGKPLVGMIFTDQGMVEGLGMADDRITPIIK